jgi:hypothetical protein
VYAPRPPIFVVFCRQCPHAIAVFIAFCPAFMQLLTCPAGFLVCYAVSKGLSNESSNVRNGHLHPEIHGKPCTAVRLGERCDVPEKAGLGVLCVTNFMSTHPFSTKICQFVEFDTGYPLTTRALEMDQYWQRCGRNTTAVGGSRGASDVEHSRTGSAHAY